MDFSRRRMSAAIAVGACLILIIGSVIFFISTHNKASSPEKNTALFTAYFQKDLPPRTNYPILAQALADYQHDNYKTMLDLDLANLTAMTGGKDQKEIILELGYYYKGISYLATNQPAAASTSLQWLIDHAGSIELIEKAQWYKALALIRTGNIPEAIELLRAVAGYPVIGGYPVLAHDLLRELAGKGNR